MASMDTDVKDKNDVQNRVAGRTRGRQSWAAMKGMVAYGQTAMLASRLSLEQRGPMLVPVFHPADVECIFPICEKVSLPLHFHVR